MKSPLRYQVTHYDCGTTSLTNALIYLFERDEIPLELPRRFALATCDRYLSGAEGLRGGTSGAAMTYLTCWLNDYASRTGLPLACEYLRDEDVTMHEGGRIEGLLGEGAAIVAGVCLGSDHYVLLTGLEDDGAVRVFDPYYDTWPLHELDAPVVGTRMVDDCPFTHNRLVERWVFDEPAGTPYSFSQKTCREALVLRRTD